MAGPGGSDRPNPRRRNSPGGLPNEGIPDEDGQRDSAKDLKKWLDRNQQKALKGGLLSGPLNDEGVGGVELVNLLRSNPDLAKRVREWMKAQSQEYRSLPGTERTGGRQDALFKEFPELYQQYVSATGQGLVYDENGNPVRAVNPNDTYGMREGDEFVPPRLIGAEGEDLPLPSMNLEPAATETENQFLAARQARLQAEVGEEAPFFSLEELQGGEE